MKKQLLIAAVAATMTSVAIADISLTGNMKVNYKNTDTNGTTVDKVTNETNLVATGSNGATKVHMEFSLDSNATTSAGSDVKSEDVWLSTKIGDVAVKTGTWNGTDTILAKDSTRDNGNWILSTTVSGAKIALEGDSETSATSTTISGDIAGVSAKYKAKSTSDELYLSSDVAGFGVTYAMIDADATDKSAAAFTISKEFNGVTVSYSDVDADTGYTVTGDTAAFGDTASTIAKFTPGDDATAIKLATTVGGNAVSVRMVSVDGLTANTDFDVNTFTATRALAGGTTLEVTYTDIDMNGSTSDVEQLDVELAVKF